MCICSCWMKSPRNINEVKLVDSVCYIPVGFSISSILVLLITERRALKPPLKPRSSLYPHLGSECLSSWLWQGPGNQTVFTWVEEQYLSLVLCPKLQKRSSKPAQRLGHGGHSRIIHWMLSWDCGPVDPNVQSGDWCWARMKFSQVCGEKRKMRTTLCMCDGQLSFLGFIFVLFVLRNYCQIQSHEDLPPCFLLRVLWF